MFVFCTAICRAVIISQKSATCNCIIIAPNIVKFFSLVRCGYLAVTWLSNAMVGSSNHSCSGSNIQLLTKAALCSFVVITPWFS